MINRREFFLRTAATAGAAAFANFPYHLFAGTTQKLASDRVKLGPMQVEVSRLAQGSFAYLTPGNVRDLSIPMAQRRYLRTGWTAKQEDAGSWWIVTVGRLKPGVSPKSAQSQVSALFLNDLLHGDKPMAKAEDAPAITLVPSQPGMTGVRKQILPLLYALM